EKNHGLGLEHPLCDSIQLLMLILFFLVWGIDSLSHYLLGISTVLIESTALPYLFLPALFAIAFSVYLLRKSSEAVFGETAPKERTLLESGVYSLVRHPMYLGVLIFCVAFLFAVLSLAALVAWIAFFVAYDRMTVFEERDLIRIYGRSYIAYQQRVPKWFLLRRYIRRTG
ncbi:MAG: isoprenylcysteine carboxylmethyltransferase family protein, partial [Candidatus Bathyarchaeota archaeon]